MNAYRLTKSTDPIGEQLRAIRQAGGYSLGGLEKDSAGQWKAVTVGSWERGDRRPTVEQVRALLAWYGDYRLEIVGPGEVVGRFVVEGGGS